MRVISSRYQILVGRCAGIVSASRLEREPITKVKAFRPEKTRTRLCPLVFHPRTHAWVLSRENSGVSVGLIDIPRDDDRHIRPARTRRETRIGASDDIGNHPRHRAIGMLIGCDISEPLRKKSGNVHVERRGAREDLRVTRPTESLVTLRTIGGDVEEVSALSPDDVLLQPVHQRIRCLECARRRHVGVDDDSGDRNECRRSREAIDSDVAETLKGEVRLEDLDAFPAQGVAHRLRGIAQIRRVKIPGLVQHLGVAQSHGRSSGPAHF